MDDPLKGRQAALSVCIFVSESGRLPVYFSNNLPDYQTSLTIESKTNIIELHEHHEQPSITMTIKHQ